MRFVTASVTVVFCASYRRAITDNLFPKKSPILFAGFWNIWIFRPCTFSFKRNTSVDAEIRFRSVQSGW